MADVEHVAAILGEIHFIKNWEFANLAARTALVAVPGDVGKVAVQTDKNTWWVLIDDSPLTWRRIDAACIHRTIVANDSATDDDDLIYIDVTGGDVTLTLMPIAERDRLLKVKCIPAGSGNIGTVDGNGAQTISGNVNIEMVGGEAFTLNPQSATNWETV
jgi:hypothetical protein